MTALLNDAFRTLRDPFARAEYFFKHAAIELPKDLSPAMLEEFFELNMLVQEFKAGDESVRPQLIEAQQLQAKVREEFSRQLVEFFAQYDGWDAEARRDAKLVEPIGDLLNARRYTDNFLGEVEKVLNVHVSD
jgi:molecular chaperone HscB